MRTTPSVVLLPLLVLLSVGCGRKAGDAAGELRSAEFVLTDRAYEARVPELSQHLDRHVRSALAELDLVLVSSDGGAYRAGDGQRVVDVVLVGHGGGGTTIRVSAARSASMRDAVAVDDLPFARQVLSGIVGSIRSGAARV